MISAVLLGAAEPAGILSPGQIAPPLRHVLRHHKNVRVELADVTGFDLERGIVHASRCFETPLEPEQEM